MCNFIGQILRRLTDLAVPLNFSFAPPLTANLTEGLVKRKKMVVVGRKISIY